MWALSLTNQSSFLVIHTKAFQLFSSFQYFYSNWFFSSCRTSKARVIFDSMFAIMLINFSSYHFGTSYNLVWTFWRLWSWAYWPWMVKTSSCWVVCILWNCLFNSKMYSSTLCFLSFVANLYVVATCITYPTCPIVWEKATKKPQVFFHSLEASHSWCRNSLHTHELQTFGALPKKKHLVLVTTLSSLN